MMTDAREFVASRHIVTLPTADTPVVRETPSVRAVERGVD